MEPPTFSPTALDVFVGCPARYKAEIVEKIPQLSGSAASLGTLCHTVLERIVPNMADPNGLGRTALLHAAKIVYGDEYNKIFDNQDRYEEGWKMIERWVKRTDLSGVDVVAMEEKRRVTINTKYGPKLLTYMIDRLDRVKNTTLYKVIDYKTFAMPLQPADIKGKLQARVYAMCVNIDYTDATQIMVIFDLLRWDAVGCGFSVEENRRTYTYVKMLIEQIIESDGSEERINDGCRWCVRKNVCETLAKSARAGGQLAVTDPMIAVGEINRLDNIIGGLRNQIADYQQVVFNYMKDQEAIEFDSGELSVKLSVSSRRDIDSRMVVQIVGMDIAAEYAKIGVTAVDDMISSNPKVTDDMKAKLKSLFNTNLGEPKLSIKKKPIV